MNWSHFQTDIYNAFEHTADSLLIEAVAGSGKTTVLVELSRIMAQAFPEQRAVFVAFNRSIADELARRISASNVRAMTLHSAGWSAWRRAGGLEWEPRVKNDKVSGIMREVLSYEENKRFGDTTRKLVGYAKGIGLVPGLPTKYHVGRLPEFKHFGDTLMKFRPLVGDTDEVWEELIDHYGLDEAECNIPLVRKVLARSIETMREVVDFDDMLFAPVIAGVPFDRYDVVLVDEAQDVSGIQMEMISRMVAHNDPMVGDISQHQPWRHLQGRVIAVGDRKQSIYGFRGAGTDSMDIFQRRFQMRPLSLSVSYRCPVAVVEHARQWVPQIEAREDAPWGYVGLEGTNWAGQAEVALGAPLEVIPLGEVRGRVSEHGNIKLSEAYKDLPPGEYTLKLDTEEESCLMTESTGAVPMQPLAKENDTTSTAPCGKTGKTTRTASQTWTSATAEGITKWRGIQDFLPGDAILCRLTRPVVAAAFALIRNRIACHVLGRDIGKGLVELVRKAKSLQNGTVEAFSSWLDSYEAKESARLYSKNKHAQAGLLGDKCDTIRVFMEQLAPDDLVPRLIAEIERLFVDNGTGQQSMVVLSTIHKFKGCERDRVFILDAGELQPCRWARQPWELKQEENLSYVAATRARRELRYIRSSDLT